MGIKWRNVDPKQLRDEFRKDIEELLGPSQWDWYVLYGYRTLAEQEILYNIYVKGGAKAAPPGLSPHNYGLAVDIVPDSHPEISGLQPDWITTSIRWVWLFAKVAMHPRLKSGKAFDDSDHIERVNWKDYK